MKIGDNNKRRQPARGKSERTQDFKKKPAATRSYKRKEDSDFAIESDFSPKKRFTKSPSSSARTKNFVKKEDEKRSFGKRNDAKQSSLGKKEYKKRIPFEGKEDEKRPLLVKKPSGFSVTKDERPARRAPRIISNSETNPTKFVETRFSDNKKMRSRKTTETADYNPNEKYSKKKQLEFLKKNTNPDEPMRLNRFLANAGLCSRREADEYIAAGVVTVNGEVVTEMGAKVIPSKDRVLFHDQLVRSEKKVYLLLNKPKDCVTTTDDPNARLTVMDLVKNACSERIYPVGRLDRNTTGVLLLTNDGDMAARLTHPKYNKKKIYHVFLDKAVIKADMEKIAHGIVLEDGEIHADNVEYVEDDKKQVGIEIHSGKNRIVRRIFEHLGYSVVRLDRVYFAGLTKKKLARGKWRFLTEKEINMLRMGAYE